MRYKWETHTLTRLWLDLYLHDNFVLFSLVAASAVASYVRGTRTCYEVLFLDAYVAVHSVFGYRKI